MTREKSIAEGVRQRATAAELKRQGRWHATRDAVLPAIYTEALNHGMSVDEVLHDAATYADRAHGPLEAKAAAVIPPIEHASWKMSADPRVEALVKAARLVLAEPLEHECNHGESLASLLVALKPFEAVKP